MAVDSATTFAALNTALPAGSDPRSELDNNIRHVKSLLLYHFPLFSGPLTCTHTELNYVTGVTSSIQTQLNTKGAIAGQAWTGTHNFTGATVTVPTPTATTHPVTKAYADALVVTATAPTFIPTTTATSKTLVDFEQVAVTASGQTVSLPASPTAGRSVVRIRTRSGVTTTVGRNGNNIQGLAENMFIPYGNVTVTLGYQDSTDGWVLQ